VANRVFNPQCYVNGAWQAVDHGPLALQAEYAVWLNALPEALRDSATGEALEAILELDLNDLIAIEPPRGYGRD